MKWFIVLSMLCYYLTFFSTETIEVMVWNIHICNNTNHTIRGFYELKNITGGLMLTGAVFITEDFGNDNKYSCQVFSYTGNKKRQLLNINSKGACDAISKYGGSFFMDLQRRGGVEKPGHCPVPKKTYKLDWVKLNFSTFNLMQIVPNGKFHVQCKMLDMSGKLIKACGSFDASKMD